MSIEVASGPIHVLNEPELGIVDAGCVTSLMTQGYNGGRSFSQTRLAQIAWVGVNGKFLVWRMENTKERRLHARERQNTGRPTHPAAINQTRPRCYHDNNNSAIHIAVLYRNAFKLRYTTRTVVVRFLRREYNSTTVAPAS